MSKERINDVGAVLPFARKHTVEHNQFEHSKSEVSLRSLWPEPDWKKLIVDGLDPHVASRLSMTYKGFRKKPRVSSYWSISEAQWEAGFVQAVGIMKALFDVTTIEDAKTINARLAKHLGFRDTRKVIDAGVEKSFVYWSLGRGERILKPPASMSTLHRNLAPYLPDLGWPESNAAIKAGRFPVSFTDGSWGACWVSGKSIRYNNSEIFNTEVEVLDFIRKTLEEEQSPPLVVPTKPSCENVQRIGRDYREGDIPAETLLQTFRFRGVQFGESMGEKEKQRWINSIFDSLTDLSSILSLPASWLGLGGIGIAFGARGKGGALAHYETDLRVINLTRNKGASSLGHEWLHALDHRLGKSIYGGSGFASSGVSRRSAPESEKMVSVFNTLKQIISEITDRKNSEYYRRSQLVQGIKGSRNYWTTRHELLARAFESFLQDKLRDAGVISPWLVYGTRPEDYRDMDVRTFPYPLSEERERLNGLFDLFFQHLGRLSR